MRWGRLTVLVGLAVVALAVAGAGSGAPRTPSPIGGGGVVQHLPAFAWTRIAGADSYEFQIAADPGFKSNQIDIVTANTRATLTKSLPNGTYWWRVRALSKNGAVSGWSGARTVTKRWSSAVRLLWPRQGATVDFPNTPLTLRWAPVTGAEKYLVSFGTHKDDNPNPNPTDKDCNSLIGGRGVETAATSYTENFTPAVGADGQPKEYYWSVTPLDPEHNRGNESVCSSFKWSWDPWGANKAQLDKDLCPNRDALPPTEVICWSDLRPEQETFDPLLSWKPVQGAASYEVEINSADDFAPGSRVCCNQKVSATSLSPTHLFRDNTYYWRVRPFNADGNAGAWSPAGTQGTFEKVFDRGNPSIQDVHLVDLSGNRVSTGASTNTPILVWNPVPGASSYFVEVAPYNKPVSGVCNWTSNAGHWRVNTAATAWTPLGSGRTGQPPYPSRVSPATDSPHLDPGTSYCVRIRARADRDDKNNEVQGDFTYLPAGPDAPAFTFSNFPQGASSGYLGAGAYTLPSRGTLTKTTPYFTWQPSVGRSWYVIIAKDPDFHTVVDYAFTQVPAYAPRRGSNAITYSDETTTYYWAVLPAPLLNGQGAVGNPLDASASTFQKRSDPPTLSGPLVLDGGQLVFHWSPVDGARKYHLQVSRDGDFGNVIDDVTTDSISYTSNKSYPADVKLYWRVRAETEDGVGLAWSSPVGQFTHQWPAPKLINITTSGDVIPTIQWQPVVGAAWYDLHVEQPNNGSKDFSRIRSAAVTPTRMTGTGNFRWKVRAEFSSGSGSPAPGPYSRWHEFTRTIGKPHGLQTFVGARALVLSWAPKAGARRYQVKISRTPDFRHTVDSTSTDETIYAPNLDGSFRGGGLFYWEVAAVDEGGNTGAYSKLHRFRIRLPKK